MPLTCLIIQMDNTIALEALFSALRAWPHLLSIPLTLLTCFMHCASLLKDDILQPQPITVPIDVPASVLPDIITQFLSACFDISADDVDFLWEVLNETVWMFPTLDDEHAACACLFKQYGTGKGIGRYTSTGVSTRSLMITNCTYTLSSIQGLPKPNLWHFRMAAITEEGRTPSHCCFHPCRHR
jgi:hypothetical protein